MSLDFLIDDDGDLLEGNDNDLVEGDSDPQHLQDILQLEPGEIFTDPLMGVGIDRYINGRSDASLRRSIYLQLEADGFTVNKITTTGTEQLTQIEIDASR